MDCTGKRILIVDDSVDTREMYARFLEPKGFDVALAEDGKQGLEQAFELGPDLIVMDLSIPKISGWDVTRQIKASEKSKHVPIIILTRHATGAAAAVIKEACEGFLFKPCLPEDLHKEIVRVLGEQIQVSEKKSQK